MAKKSKKVSVKQPESSKPVSGGMYSHEAELALINYLTKMPDGDEVLRKAGVTRHRLKVMMYDDEIYQCIEKRQDKLEAAPFRIEPADTPAAKILTEHMREWWSEIILGAQNARWYGYSVLEAIYNKPEQPNLHIDGDTITPFIGFNWIGEKPLQWYEPKNDGRLLLLANYNKIRRDQEVDQRFKHFLTRCKPTYEQPYGEALLSRLYWVWFFKNNGFKFWAKFVEKFGMPILVGKSATGHNEAMKSALLNAHASSVLAISKTDEVTVQGGSNGTGSGSGVYETFDKNLERRIQKVILGQTLTSGTDGAGSMALGKVHKEVQDDKFKADLRMITPTIQAILNALCDINQWPRHTIVILEDKPLKDDQAGRDAKLKDAGANLTNQYFEREYGLHPGDLQDQVDQPVVQNVQFNALPRQAFSFAATTKTLSPEQQEVEELTDAQHDIELLSNARVNELLQKSETPEDLAFHLMQLMPDASQSQFTANLERALYAGDVLGYMTASEGK